MPKNRPNHPENDDLDATSGAGASQSKSKAETEDLMAEVQGMIPAWLPMLECLQSKEVDVPRKLETLKRLKPHLPGISGFQIIPQLVQLLRTSHEANLNLQLIKVLGEIKTQCVQDTLIDISLAMGIDFFEEAPPPFEAFLELEAVIRLRCYAIRMLGLLGDTQAIIPLMSLLNDEALNYRVRLEAAEALGRLKNSQALNPLIDILKNKQPPSLYLQESAVKALGMLGDIRAIDPLLELFEAQQGFKQKCQFLIERILGSVSQLVEQGSVQVDEKTKALDRIVEAMHDDAYSIRVAAIEALSNIGDISHLPLLKKALFDEHMDVAHTALVAVYTIGEVDELKQLLELEELPRFLREEILDFLVLESDDTSPDTH
jgi:HEAT repeat protein